MFIYNPLKTLPRSHSSVNCFRFPRSQANFVAEVALNYRTAFKDLLDAHAGGHAPTNGNAPVAAVMISPAEDFFGSFVFIGFVGLGCN
jgi:hypothetical protein